MINLYRQWTVPTTIRLATIITVLASCAPAVKHPEMAALDVARLHGYEERALGGDRFEVSYKSREREASLDEKERQKEVRVIAAKAHDFALWRAAMVASRDGFPAFSVLDHRIDVDVTIDDERAYFAGAACSSFGFCGGAYDPDYREAWVRVRVVLTVRMHRAVAEGAHEPEETARRLKAFYPRALAPPKPTK